MPFTSRHQCQIKSATRSSARYSYSYVDFDAEHIGTAAASRRETRCLEKRLSRCLYFIHTDHTQADLSHPAEMVGRAKVAANKRHSGTRINPDGMQVAAYFIHSRTVRNRLSTGAQDLSHA